MGNQSTLDDDGGEDLDVSSLVPCMPACMHAREKHAFFVAKKETTLIIVGVRILSAAVALLRLPGFAFNVLLFTKCLVNNHHLLKLNKYNSDICNGSKRTVRTTYLLKTN